MSVTGTEWMDGWVGGGCCGGIKYVSMQRGIIKGHSGLSAPVSVI